MRNVLLDGTNLRLSRIGFGTGRLFSLRSIGSTSARHRLLTAAYDSGITHFDTAPSYGSGIAESDLRAILASHPDATVATKVGIYTAGGEDQTPISVAFRKGVGKIIPSLCKKTVDWSVDRARRSLDGSLRRLGRERVDLYLLHEPHAHLLAADEWLQWLECERDRVANFGIACEAGRLAPFLASESPLAKIVQCSDSVEGREADVLIQAGRPLQITFGYFSEAKRHPNFCAEKALAGALRRNSAGCILVSTGRPERIGGLVSAVDKHDATAAVACAS